MVDTLVIGNQFLTKKIISDPDSAAPITVMVFDDRNQVVCSSNDKVPYFEFVINQQLVSASDALWQYKDHSARSLQNGGVEYKIVFEGVVEPVKGMQVILCQQTFPDVTLIREKLELGTTGPTLTLNKLDGHLHFRFPQYAFKKNVRSNAILQATEIRLASWELRPATFTKDGSESLVQNHMFYPEVVTTRLEQQTNSQVKGPVNMVYNGELTWMTAYEHASQDNLNGILNKNDHPEPGKLVDQLQGTKGVFDFKQSDDDFRFLGILYQNNQDFITVSLDIVRGGYLEGESIDLQHDYQTVWSASAFYPGNDLADGQLLLRKYLFKYISEKSASRVPEFYYNTWGMQREVGKRMGPEMLRGVMDYDHIYAEIERAKDLGIDIFVLDDGWEEAQGIWKPHAERLPEGLAPIKKYLDQYDIKLGLWFSPLGIDSSTVRFKDHPEWVIKDSEGNPVGAQWGHPAFDFVSDFFDLFIEDCKKLIDQGALFFKWDAINTLYSTLPDLDHGSSQYTHEEIRERYEYLLPIYVTQAMQVLTDYQPDLVIEIDLTEARRVMMGLAPLSQGKLFFMNNGASAYNDYSSYRAKSMRSIVNEYSGLIPLELFTYANYPHNLDGYMDYNVNNSLIAGHGFWGNLELTKEEERKAIGKKVHQSKLILPYITEVDTKVIGKVGDSPEIYEQINADAGAGQIIVFSEEKIAFEHKVDLTPEKFLAILGHPYHDQDQKLNILFDLDQIPYTGAAMILPNRKQGISIISSTAILDEVSFEDLRLTYRVANAGVQEISWDTAAMGTPLVKGNHIYIENNDLQKGSLKVRAESATTIIIDFQ